MEILYVDIFMYAFGNLIRTQLRSQLNKQRKAEGPSFFNLKMYDIIGIHQAGL